MLLMDRENQHVIEVLSMSDLTNPCHSTLAGRYHYGEEVQDPELFDKNQVLFLSGETLPRCWTDAHYRDERLRR